MRPLFRLLFFAATSLFMAQKTAAQVTVASLSGTVKSTSGEALEGATISILHLPTGLKTGAISDEKGIFHLENLRPVGPYSAEATFLGFQNQTETGLFFALGEASRIDFSLLEKTAKTTEIQVLADRNGTFDSRRAGTSTNIRREAVENLPTLSRSLSDLTRLTPQANGNSFGGANFRMNNLSIDGAAANDAFGFVEPTGGASGSVASGTPGNLARSQPISLDAIAEVQVALSSYEVSRGNFTGASLNAVTRSGSNKTEGSAYFFGRNGFLTRRDLDENKQKKGPTDFFDGQIGARLGGAIRKNKLFYFINAEKTGRREPVGFRPGTEDSNISTEVAQMISDTLRSRYGIDAGSFGDLELLSSSEKVFARLDWNTGQRHQLTLRHNYSNAAADHLSRARSILNFESQGFRHSTRSNASVFQAKSRFGERVFNDLIVGFSSILDQRDPFGDQILPHIEITYNSTNQIFAGSYREAAIFKIDQKSAELTENLTIYRGKHAFLAGVYLENYWIDYHFVTPFNGRWAYSSLDNFLADRPSRVRATYAFDGAGRDENFGRPSAEFGLFLGSVYLQDRIALTEKLRVLVGLRADLPVFSNRKKPISEVAEVPEFAGYGNQYGSKAIVSPRFSFNYQPTKSVQIRGGAGSFMGRMPLAWLAYSHIYDGQKFGNVDLRPSGKLPIVTDFSKISELQKGQREINLVADGFRMPQIWRTNAAIDWQIGSKTTLGLEFLASKTVRDPLFQTLNLNDSTINLAGADGRPIFLGSGAGQKVRPEFTSVFGLTNTKKGFRRSLTASAATHFFRYFEATAAWTYGLSKDVSNGVRVSPQANWEWNQTARPNAPELSFSNFDARNRLVFSLFWAKMWSKTQKTQVAVIATAQSGSPFSFTYSGDLNRDGSPTNDLFFVPADRSQINLTDIKNAAGAVTATADEQWAQLEAYISENEYLTSQRGQITERNGARTPWNSTIDLRLTETVKIGRRSVQISLDAINFGNLLNPVWGRQFFVANTLNSSFQLVRVASVAGEKATFQFQNPVGEAWQIDPLASKWQMQLGLRFNF